MRLLRPFVLCLTVSVLSACGGQRLSPNTGITTPTSTREIAPFAPLTDRLRDIVQFQTRALAATGTATATMPNALRFADGISTAVLVGEAGDYVVIARGAGPTSAVCRYHGGASGDHLTVCIDAKGQTWRLLMPDLADGR